MPIQNFHHPEMQNTQFAPFRGATLIPVIPAPGKTANQSLINDPDRFCKSLYLPISGKLQPPI